MCSTSLLQFSGLPATALNILKMFCCLFSSNRLKSLVTAYTSTFILATMKNWPINWEDRFHLKTWKFLMACSVLTQCSWWVTIWKEDRRKMYRTILTNPSFWEWKALWQAGGKVSTFVHPPTGWGKISISFLKSNMLFPCNLKLKPFCNWQFLQAGDLIGEKKSKLSTTLLQFGYFLFQGVPFQLKPEVNLDVQVPFERLRHEFYCMTVFIFWRLHLLKWKTLLDLMLTLGSQFMSYFMNMQLLNCALWISHFQIQCSLNFKVSLSAKALGISVFIHT